MSIVVELVFESNEKPQENDAMGGEFDIGRGHRKGRGSTPDLTNGAV